MSIIILEKSVSQVSKEEEKNILERRDNFYRHILDKREELSVGKITRHVFIEGIHCWVVVMLKKRHVCLEYRL